MTTKLALVLGALIIAGISFWAGTYYTISGGRVFLPGTQSDTVTGQVAALSDASLTMRLPDGSEKTLSVGPQTVVVMSAPPAPRSFGDLSPGTQVTAVVVNGKVQLIDIAPTAPFSPQ